jgi:hypothetical protein
MVMKAIRECGLPETAATLVDMLKKTLTPGLKKSVLGVKRFADYNRQTPLSVFRLTIPCTTAIVESAVRLLLPRYWV